MDSMSSRVDSVGSGVQLIIEQQDIHNKKVLLVTCERYRGLMRSQSHCPANMFARKRADAG